MRSSSIISLLLGVSSFFLLLACGGSPSDNKPATPAADAPKAYFVSNSTLYLSQLSSDGSDTAIGTVKLADNTPISLTDIATTAQGQLYGNSFTQLYTIDKSTAIATPIGANTLTSINALAFDANGNLFGASSLNGSFYSINKNDGKATIIGLYGSSWISSGDLAFDSTGVLWASVQAPADINDRLATVNISSGIATQKFNNLPLNIWGLTFTNNTLYAASNATNSLYSINLNTGVATLIRPLSFPPYGGMDIPRKNK